MPLTLTPPPLPPTHTHTPAEKETVFEVKVDDVSCVYRAGSKLLFLRILQGSAVITMETQNGEEKYVRIRTFHHVRNLMGDPDV